MQNWFYSKPVLFFFILYTIEARILFVSQVIDKNHSFQSHNSVCINSTDFLSFDDFVGDAFDEGVRHRRSSFHKVPPIKRKVEKVFRFLISVESLKTVLIQPKCYRSSESNFHCSFVCRALRNRRRPASLQPSPMALPRENRSPQNPRTRSVLILR